jgi:hypothetical protein
MVVLLSGIEKRAVLAVGSLLPVNLNFGRDPHRTGDGLRCSDDEGSLIIQS